MSKSNTELMRRAEIALRESMLRARQFPVFFLVEDDSMDAALIAREFDLYFTEKCALIRFACGEDLLKVLPGVKPAAVLLDLVLPTMTGIECLKIIKELYPELPVIAVTGLSEGAAAMTEAMRLGVVKLLVKPLNQEKLRNLFTTP